MADLFCTYFMSSTF